MRESTEEVLGGVVGAQRYDRRRRVGRHVRHVRRDLGRLACEPRRVARSIAAQFARVQVGSRCLFRGALNAPSHYDTFERFAADELIECADGGLDTDELFAAPTGPNGDMQPCTVPCTVKANVFPAPQVYNAPDVSMPHQRAGARRSRSRAGPR